MEGNKKKEKSRVVRLIDQLEEVVRCSICLQPYQDPRNLGNFLLLRFQLIDCKHTFCLFCLHNLYRSKANPSKLNPNHVSHLDAIMCPNCKHETAIDSSLGVDTLPKNKDMATVASLASQFLELTDLNNFQDEIKPTTQIPTTNGLPRETLGVPFRINENQATQRLKAWFPNLRDCPLDLPQAIQKISLEAKFCPCFEFKVTANSKFSVRLLVNQASHQTTADHGSLQCKNMFINKGSQYSVLIYASQELDERFRRDLEAFQVEILADEDLSRFIEEKKIEVMPRSITRDVAQSDAELKVQDLEREACGASVLQRYRGAYSYSDLVCSTSCERILVSPRLLPVFIGTYTYKVIKCENSNTDLSRIKSTSLQLMVLLVMFLESIRCLKL
jgi:hypothetical protein